MTAGRYLLAAAAAVALGSAQTAPAPEPVRLRDVLAAAPRRATAEQARLELARSQARLLETQNKVRVDFRPSFGLLSFSNPLLLAANLGSGFSIGKRNAPTPAQMQNAWFDVVSAEVAVERARTRAQADAARAFYSLLEKQELAAQAGEMLSIRAAGAAEVARLVKVSRATALDRLAADQNLLDAELAQVETESGRAAAAMELAVLIGRPELAPSIRAAEDAGAGELKLLSFSDDKQTDEVVLERALRHRADVQVLRERIDSMRVSRSRLSGIKPQSVSGAYGFVAGVPGGVSRSAESFLLGGNSARVDLNLGLSLRNTGEKAAQEELMESRARLLEAELRAASDELRVELHAARTAVQAMESRLRIAQRKLELARSAEAMTVARISGGLADAQAQVASRQAMHQAQAEVVRARCQHRAGLLALWVMTGWDGGAAGLQTARQQ